MDHVQLFLVSRRHIDVCVIVALGSAVLHISVLHCVVFCIMFFCLVVL